MTISLGTSNVLLMPIRTQVPYFDLTRRFDIIFNNDIFTFQDINIEARRGNNNQTPNHLNGIIETNLQYHFHDDNHMVTLEEIILDEDISRKYIITAIEKRVHVAQSHINLHWMITSMLNIMVSIYIHQEICLIFSNKCPLSILCPN